MLLPKRFQTMFNTKKNSQKLFFNKELATLKISNPAGEMPNHLGA